MYESASGKFSSEEVKVIRTAGFNHVQLVKDEDDWDLLRLDDHDAYLNMLLRQL